MSLFYHVLEAVAGEVDSVLAGHGVPVLLRRRNVWVNGDPLPVCIVSPADEERLAEMDFTGGTTWVYPVNVNLVYPDDRDNSLDLDAEVYLDVREAIRDQLFFPLLAGVAEVWDVDISATRPFTLPDQRGTASSSGYIFKFKAKQERRMAP